jgi:hypothetical protein
MSISPDAAAGADPAVGADPGPSAMLLPKEAATIHNVRSAEIIAFVCLINVSLSVLSAEC